MSQKEAEDSSIQHKDVHKTEPEQKVKSTVNIYEYFEAL